MSLLSSAPPAPRRRLPAAFAQNDRSSDNPAEFDHRTARESSTGVSSGMSSDISQQLRDSMLAIRLSFMWPGVRRSLSTEQTARAAESFGASHRFLSAGKKLFDTREPEWRAVASIRSRALTWLKRRTLPFPEHGLRLMRRHDLDDITERLIEFRDELETTVGDLEVRFEDLKRSAQARLGDLYSTADYPPSLRDEFQMFWHFPSVEAPDYLRQLNPALYRQEASRVRQQFEEAVRLAEGAFAEELSEMIEHLAERISGASDGRPKVFRNSAVDNLNDFFERFRDLNIGSSEQLDEVVRRPRDLMQGVQPADLRDSQSLRSRLSQQLSGVQESLGTLLVDQPRRRIQREQRVRSVQRTDSGSPSPTSTSLSSADTPSAPS